MEDEINWSTSGQPLTWLSMGKYSKFICMCHPNEGGQHKRNVNWAQLWIQAQHNLETKNMFTSLSAPNRDNNFVSFLISITNSLEILELKKINALQDNRNRLENK